MLFILLLYISFSMNIMSFAPLKHHSPLLHPTVLLSLIAHPRLSAHVLFSCISSPPIQCLLCCHCIISSYASIEARVTHNITTKFPFLTDWSSLEHQITLHDSVIKEINANKNYRILVYGYLSLFIHCKDFCTNCFEVYASPASSIFM